MRCVCCNANLNDFESTRRSVTTGEFLDMCNQCYKGMSQVLPSTTRVDLNPYDEIEQEVSLEVDMEGIDVEENDDFWEER